MFYVTQIKSVGQSGVIDVQGRRLNFIGHLPVKAGDSVYTDGNVIFGNAPPKGAPAIFDNPSGIPVLADEDSSGENELRGYFTNRGKFKKYGVKGDDWITNSDKRYAHDDDDGKNIIDAEITDDGVYTVEKKVTQIEPNDADFYLGRHIRVGTSVPVEVLLVGTEHYSHNVVVTATDDFSDVRAFKKGDVGFSGRERESSTSTGYLGTSTGAASLVFDKCMFYLRRNVDFRKVDDRIVKSCELIIRKDNAEVERVNLNEFLKDFEDAAKNDVDILEGRESVNHSITRFNLYNFKILPDGSWTALIIAEIWAARTFYVAGFDIVDQSSIPSTYVTDNRDTISSTANHRVLQLKITSSGYIETLWGWAFRYPLYLVDSYYDSPMSFETQDEIDEFEDSLPETIGDNTRVRFIYDARDTSPLYGRISYYVYYSSYKLTPELSFNTPVFADEIRTFTFPVQDDFYAEITRKDSFVLKRQLVSIRDKDENLIVDGNDENISAFVEHDGVDGVDTAHMWNMSIVKLKNGNYLFGFRDTKGIDGNGDTYDIGGKLFKIDSNGKVEEVVGVGFKNFRLRELKNISKAKK